MTLSDKLKSLGVKIGARDLPRPKPRRSIPIEDLVPGRFHDTPFGQTFVAEKVYPLDFEHGQYPLQLPARLSAIADWARDSRLSQFSPDSFAFLDTETTGLAGGTGTFAFMVGVGIIAEGQFRLLQFFMRDPVEEPAQLAALTQCIQDCEALVTFNGKAFDVPLLNARYIFNGVQSPLLEMPHLDLLLLARRLWRRRLPSRALGYLEPHILGVIRDEQDIPGWMIPGMYFDYLHTGDASPLKRVFYHNTIDILSLATLLSHMNQMLENPLTADVPGLDLVAMANLFEDLGQWETAVPVYKRGLELELPSDLYCQTVQRLAVLHRRNDQILEAVALWRLAAADRHIYAHVELAKYCEHRQRDFPQAIQWTRSALQLINAPDYSRRDRRHWLPELEHRLQRLNRKQGKQT